MQNCNIQHVRHYFLQLPLCTVAVSVQIIPAVQQLSFGSW